MIKSAFKMKLKPGARPEYEKRHQQIWPELLALLKSNGVRDYSIFFDEQTNVLFAVQRQTGLSSQGLGDHAVMQLWWAYMADLMETNEDRSPVSIPLDMIFHMD